MEHMILAKLAENLLMDALGLYNEQIAELFNLTKLGTQVLII